ncbi:MAG: hypothetical protein ACI9E5_000766 [Candidatus Omnitrophota bacterium]
MGVSMKTLAEFKQLYNTQLLPELRKLEEMRKERVTKILIVCGPIAAIAIIGSIAMIKYGEAAFWVLAIGAMICCGIGWFLTRDYVKAFKGQVIERIVHFIDPALKYSRESYIPHNEFKTSKLFLQHADKYKGDDRVTGRVGVTSLDFSELHAQYVTRDSKGRRSYHTFFKGLFFVGDFNKHFKGQTFVLPDSAEKMFGGIGKWMQGKNMSRPALVKLEDPDFEKLFVVYGTDQIESRYVLSTSMMRRMTEFKRKTGRKVWFSFINNKIYMAIYYRKNLFEPRIFKTLLDFKPIEEYFEDLSFAIGIVEDLNLNTRIWSKE